jgi:hypothetical protein
MIRKDADVTATSLAWTDIGKQRRTSVNTAVVPVGIQTHSLVLSFHAVMF